MKEPYRYPVFVHCGIAFLALVVAALITIAFPARAQLAPGFAVGAVTVWLLYNAYLQGQEVTRS